MQNKLSKTPAQVNYRILNLIEQMMTVAPKGTSLGLCDTISAMYSGYFIESGGAVTPAIEAFLRREVKEAKERDARTRRASKAITYGSYNVKEFIERQQEIIRAEGKWNPIRTQMYRIVSVDFTAYRRTAVKKLKAKAYDSDANRAVSAVPIGMIASVGKVNEQRVALLKNVVLTDLTVNDSATHKTRLYQETAKILEEDELAVLDAGFKLVEAADTGLERCVIRLAKNCTFGKRPGQIPARTSKQGRPPTRYKAEIIRPLEREHGGKTLLATEADEIYTVTGEDGRKIKVHSWPRVYFLERHLEKVTDERKKKKMRKLPLQVMAIYDPDYENPLLIGTLLLSLEPQAAIETYAARWPVEGLPQTGKYILSGGTGTHYVHHPTAMQRLPVLSLIFGSLLKYAAATLPAFRTGFWDKARKPTYGRLLRQLKKVGIPLSRQLSKKQSVTAHLPVGYEAIRLATP